MANPIVIPPPMSPMDKLKALMRDPRIRQRVRRDPLFANWLRQQVQVPNDRSQGPNINPKSEANYLRAPVGSTLNATPMSVSDSVRKQRDAFLVADGVQVAGDYTTQIRAQQGGIPAPSMPKVGFPAAQSYRYPSRKMIVGAALAATPEAKDFTSTRPMLPTSGFNPSAFVAARPINEGNNLMINDPRPLPRRALPRSRRGVSPSLSVNRDSVSDNRRRAITTFMGLGAEPRSGLDAWSVIAANVGAIPQKEAIARTLVPVIKWLAQEGDVDCRVKDAAGNVQTNPDGSEKVSWACTGLAVAGAAARGLGRVALVNGILADKIDFRAPDGSELILPGMNVSLNRWLTENMGQLITDPGWRSLAQGVGFKFPLDIRLLGIRKTFLVIAYKAVWGKDIKPEWYLALSNDLANRGTGSLEDALRIAADRKYDPDAKTPPVVPLNRGVSNWDPMAKAISAEIAPSSGGQMAPGAGGGAMAPAAEGPNTAVLIGGGVLAAALVAAGIWMKRSA